MKKTIKKEKKAIVNEVTIGRIENAWVVEVDYRNTAEYKKYSFSSIKDALAFIANFKWF